MRIAAAATVRNEADIVEAFVRHTLRFADELWILLHRSTDGTSNVVRALVDEGLPVRLFVVESPAFAQGRWMTELGRRLQREGGAEFVLLLDADEFVVADSRAVLERELLEIGSEAPIHWISDLYVPQPHEHAHDPHVLSRIRHRVERGGRPPTCDDQKVILPPNFGRRPDWSVFEGNHVIVARTATGNAPVDGPVLKSARLAHFPIRSTDQLVEKVCLGWWGIRLLGPAAAKAGIAEHWQAIYQRIASGAALDSELIATAILAYQGAPARPTSGAALVYDPVPGAVALGLTHHARRLPPIAAVCEWADRMIDLASAAPRPAAETAPPRSAP